MARIDNLPANYLKKRVGQLQTQLQQVKAPQYAGNQNVQLLRIASDAAYDFAATVTYNTVTIWEATFTPADQTFENTSLVWHNFWDEVSSVGSGSWDSATETLVPANNIQVFRIYFMGLTPSMSLTLQWKLVFYTVGNGTFTVAQIV